MSEFMYNPESLSDALDALLSGGDLPFDEPLLQTAARVLSAPPPAMSPEVSARIEAQVLDTFRTTIPVAPRFPPTPLIGGLIIAVLIIIGGLFVVSQQPNEVTPPLAAPTNTLTYTPTQTPTDTSTPTQTATPNATASASPSSTSTDTDTPTASATPTLTATVTATNQDVNLIVEGEVEAINGNVVVIYGIEININADDPLLGVIQVGDTIRVEGHITEEGSSYSIEAINIVVTATSAPATSVPAEVNPNGGESWQDDGSCNNPPPPWAPAIGWHRRCDGQSNNNNGNGNGNGGGMGMGG